MPGSKINYTDRSTGGEFSRSDSLEIRKAVNENADKLGELDLVGSQLIDWNDDFKTINVSTGTGSTLQVGQEFYFLIYNNTGIPIENGQVLKPVGGVLVGDFVIPAVILAQADNHATCEGTLFFATSNIANGSLGMATRLGRAHDLDTDGLALGADIFLSPTIAGAFTTTRPSFPDYVLGLGGVLKAHESEGQIAVSFQKRVDDTVLQAWDGSIREHFNFLVSSAIDIVTGSLERDGGGNLTLMFSDGFTTLETTPADTIELTPGTDLVPVENYIYILKSDKVLTLSTSGWPEVEHAKVANVLLFSASLTEEEGALINRNWNDHVKVIGDNGHILHITEKLRSYPSQWESGTLLTSTVVTGSTPDDVFVAVTAGVVFQLHRQSFAALNLATGDHLHVVNHNTTPYLATTNLNTLLADSNGVDLNNTSFSFVIWGVTNKGGEPNQLMLNLPEGSYAFINPSAALEDSNNFANYTIPKEFTGVGFLIARLVCTYKNDIWTVENEIDLRGTFPNAVAGASGAGIPEAPKDGNIYGRQDGTWVIIV